MTWQLPWRNPLVGAGWAASPALIPAAAAGLPDNVTINGQTASPVFSYYGQGADASAWAASAGPNLAIASTGTAPTTGKSTGLTSVPTAVGINAGKVYQAASAALQLTTGDILLRIVARSPAAGAPTIAAQRAAYGTNGWLAGFNSPTQFVVTIGTAPNLVSTCVADTLQMFHVFIDRDDTSGWQQYVNGTLKSTGNPTAASASLAGGQLLTIGATSVFGSVGTNDIALVQAYELPSGWFAGGATNGTQWAAQAAADFALLV